MSLKIGRIPLLSKPSMLLKIGLRRMAALSLNKQTSSVEIARDDYLTIAKHVIASAENETKNVVVSPVSIHTALCQLASASSGSTRSQLLTYLQSERVEHLEPFYSLILFKILADASPLGGPHLSIKGGVWPDWGHTLNPAFQNTVLCLVPRMVFADAVCFKGTWSEEFDASLTRNADFHLLNGTAIRAPFMTSQYRKRVATFDGFKVLKLPYVAGIDKRRFSMYIYLPDAKHGVPYLIERICCELGFVDNHLPHEEAVVLDEFRIPKFKIGFELEASTVLKEMGVVDLFEGGMAEIVDECLVGEVLLRALVVVDEVGTKAEGETVSAGIGLANLCPMMEKKPGLRFVANHPFVFTIREDMSGVVLFIGQLLDPLAEASFGIFRNPDRI